MDLGFALSCLLSLSHSFYTTTQILSFSVKSADDEAALDHHVHVMVLGWNCEDPTDPGGLGLSLLP